MSSQKVKGKSFEEKVADTMHKFFLENNPSYKNLFEVVKNDNVKPRRDASSGTLNNSFGDIDLGILASYFPYSIECKNWDSLTELDINSILKGKFSVLLKVWTEQTIPNAVRAGIYHKSKLFALQVFKGTRTITFCMFNMNEFAKDKTMLPENFIKYKDLIICDFNDFLELHK